MAEISDPRRPISQPGTFSRILTALAQALKWLLVSLLFSIVIEWLGMMFWWEEQGLAHSGQMLRAELGYLGEDFQRSMLTSDPLRFAQDVSRRFYHVLFELTRVVDFIEWVTPAPRAGDEGFRTTLHHAYRPIAVFVISAMQMTQVFAVRLSILTLATPVFGLFALVALVDGLVRRDLRRWGGGRESSFVYHYAKKAALPLVVIAWVLYLALPFSLHPSWVILPFAIGFGLTVTVTASTFKKYL